MPFDPEFDGVYRDLIKAPLEVGGFRVSRADDPKRGTVVHQNIYDEIVRNLWDADYIIADLTNYKPNVIYELGIAHTLNKRTVQISQQLDRAIPFDIKSQNVISYSVDNHGVSNLPSKVLEILGLASRNLYIFSNIVDDYISRSSRKIITDPPTRK